MIPKAKREDEVLRTPSSRLNQNQGLCFSTRQTYYNTKATLSKALSSGNRKIVSVKKKGKRKMTDLNKIEVANQNGVATLKKAVGDNLVACDLEVDPSSITESSALRHCVEISQRVLRQKCDVNNDNEGDKTPPPASSAALPVPVNSGIRTIASAQNQFNALVVPTDPAQMYNFVMVSGKAVEAAELLIKQAAAPAQTLQNLHEQAKKQGELILDTALELAARIKAIEGFRGKRSDLSSGGKPTKEDILNARFHISPQQAARIAKLTDEAVRKEKEYAREHDTPPTLTHALKYVQAKEQNLERSKRKQTAYQASIRLEKKVLPDGKYDIVFADLDLWSDDINVSDITTENALLFLTCEKDKVGNAIHKMEENGFIQADELVFVKIKTNSGPSKYFRNQHRNLLLGVKGEYDLPDIYKTVSVLFENNVPAGQENSAYMAIIAEMYPDGAYLDLVSEQPINPKWSVLEKGKEVENG